MITTYLLWKFYNIRLLNASPITKHINWLPRRARGILILTPSKPANCPLKVESKFFPIRIIMREQGSQKFIRNLTSPTRIMPLLGYPDSNTRTPQKRTIHTYIVNNTLLYLSMKNE